MTTTADPNRKGMRPGDFRYCDRLHSAETKAAAAAFVAAGDAWRAAYRLRNAMEVAK